MIIALFALTILATLAVIAWLYVLFQPARPWDFQPVGDDAPVPELPVGKSFPPVCILVPARNEAESLPQTLPALLSQDYPAPFSVILIDDRSTDGTAEIAWKTADNLRQTERLRVVGGAALPDGWVGKMWALQQGAREALDDGQVQFVLLTDADILHAPGSLRRLVAESLGAGLALNSRMARLRCESPAEKLLIPAFVYFFNLLYPMRRVNDPQDRMAAAAGGCVLLSRQALEGMGGGFEPIKAEIIDDVNLGRTIKKLGLPIRLSLSRSEVKSLREYPQLDEIWTMVRRTAFTELKYSWLRLAGALLGLALIFIVPLLALLAGSIGLLVSTQPGAAAYAAGGETSTLTLVSGWALFKGLFSLGLMRLSFVPAVRFFKLPSRYSCSLPLAGVLYGLMTLDSALRHARGMGLQWRERAGKQKAESRRP